MRLVGLDYIYITDAKFARSAAPYHTSPKMAEQAISHRWVPSSETPAKSLLNFHPTRIPNLQFHNFPLEIPKSQSPGKPLRASSLGRNVNRHHLRYAPSPIVRVLPVGTDKFCSQGELQLLLQDKTTHPSTSIQEVVTARTPTPATPHSHLLPPTTCRPVTLLATSVIPKQRRTSNQWRTSSYDD